MLHQKLRNSLVVLMAIIALSSCKKDLIVCEEPIPDHCEVACHMEPIPDWCPTGAPTRYFFNKTTRTCQAEMTWYDYPFETLAECEECSCTRVVPEGGN